MALCNGAEFPEDVLYGMGLKKAIQALCVDRFFGVLSLFVAFLGFSIIFGYSDFSGIIPAENSQTAGCCSEIFCRHYSFHQDLPEFFLHLRNTTSGRSLFPPSFHSAVKSSLFFSGLAGLLTPNATENSGHSADLTIATAPPAAAEGLWLA
jgi:hypothetical protein